MAVWLENIAVASSNQMQAYLICENGASPVRNQRAKGSHN
jgi:hypothetical protein